MRSIRFKLLFFHLVVAVAAAAQPAKACRMNARFHVEDIRHADVVFAGRLIRYELVSPGRPNTLDEYGLLTVRVHRVLKGRVSGDVQLYWHNSTFAMPRSMERGRPVLIAAVRADRPGLPLRGPSGTVFGTGRPDLLQVMQAPCSSPFILHASQTTVDSIRTILRGGSVAPRDYYSTE